jgi:hypothetical protein
MVKQLDLCAGELVEVRTKEEILSTLDQNGQLDNLPFMPQMFDYCGKQLRVYKRAHKTCDTVNRPSGRTMPNAVHLEGVRCDGAAYGGCQAGCLIFWKEAWLKRPSGSQRSLARLEHRDNSESGAPYGRCSEADVWDGTRSGDDGNDPTYVCQVTRLPAATGELSPWDIRQYIEDYRSGNVDLKTILAGFLYATYNNTINLGIGVGAILRWFYDRFQALRGGVPYPRHRGKIPEGQPTPAVTLNLRPGELVRIKSYREILETLNTTNKNKGLYFDAEMVPFCGGTYRVRTRVGRILNEKTGKMTVMKNERIILSEVFCLACYSEERYFCPRSIYSFWSETWLERVAPNTLASDVKACEDGPAKIETQRFVADTVVP